MSAARDYQLFLRDMLREARLAQQFLAGVELEQFLADPKDQRAVTKCIEIIGEAIRRIPEAVQKKYPEVEWRKMTATRNRLAHGYFETDYELVWRTVKEDLPVLETQIERILREMGED